MSRTTAKDVNTLYENQCPVCGYRNLTTFFEIFDVPVHCNLLWTSRNAAQHCPKGDIKLAFCPACSFITNLAFEPDRLEYTQRYENSLFYSPRFQEYALSQAAKLVKRYNLYNKDIIEIGCGQGDFLLLLCELGQNCGVGFDPSYFEKEKNREVKDRVKFIQDFYSERYANYQADFIVCRFVLEHIQNPKGFLNILREAISNRLNIYVFFEVPNTLNTFRKLFIFDIIYEHCSYFTPLSLTHTFSSSGFRVCKLTEEYEGQFLCVDAMLDHQNISDSKHELQVACARAIDQIANYITSFSVNYRNKVETYRNKLRQIFGRGQRAVIWGAGSRGVTFLNTFKDSQIEYAVDINPRKQNMYIPGTGQRIVPPEFLQEYQPDVIIIMNPIYKNEIREYTKSLGIKTKFISV